MSGMIDSLDHIALKVADIKAISAAFEALGYPLLSVKQHDEVGMKIAFMGGGEKGRMELLEVTDPGSPIAADPCGLHHLAIASDDIEEAYRIMSADPKYLVEGRIRQGAHARIFFFRIAGSDETLFECVEKQK